MSNSLFVYSFITVSITVFHIHVTIFRNFVLRTFISKYNKELQQVQKSTADARISAESSLLYVNLTV
ncbi:hypothetical protein GHT06_019075 [Daphnia sinensis]|uniref:Uncharacterized protein n=1 Tax=Daphnia sinensis TaxID=1820382 RepID=A0AAD5KKT6_9CRUS|nr:hypothetical protein GHT06_019075 [Daphnia sinensis]